MVGGSFNGSCPKSMLKHNISFLYRKQSMWTLYVAFCCVFALYINAHFLKNAITFVYGADQAVFAYNMPWNKQLYFYTIFSIIMPLLWMLLKPCSVKGQRTGQRFSVEHLTLYRWYYVWRP
jgi:hypothetical protein